MRDLEICRTRVEVDWESRGSLLSSPGMPLVGAELQTRYAERP